MAEYWIPGIGTITAANNATGLPAGAYQVTPSNPAPNTSSPAPATSSPSQSNSGGGGGSYSSPSSGSSSGGGGSSSNQTNIWGYNWAVDGSGNIFKNNTYVPDTNYGYVPQQIKDQAKSIKAGGTSSTGSGGSGGNYSGPGSANPSGAGLGGQGGVYDPAYGYLTGGQGAVAAPAPTQTDMYRQEFDKLMSQYNNDKAAWAQQLQDIARQQAEAIANQQKLSLNTAMDTTKNNQQRDLDMIANMLASGKKDVENKTFQNWLAARQGIADRGVANSGLMNDQNTRLLLNKQNALGDLYNTATSGISDVNRNYSTQLNNFVQQLAAINPNQTQAEIFQKLFSEGNKDLMKQAELYQKLIGDQLGYDYVSQDSLLKAQQFYDQLDVQNKQFYDKLESDYDIDLRKVMGYDPQTGQPTLDALKLAEEIRANKVKEYETAQHNKVIESQGWARINQSKEELDRKIDAAFEAAVRWDSEMDAKGKGEQADALKTIITTSGNRLKDLQSAIKSTDPKNKNRIDELKAEYNRELAKFEGATESLANAYNITFDKESVPKVTPNVQAIIQNFSDGAGLSWSQGVNLQ